MTRQENRLLSFVSLFSFIMRTTTGPTTSNNPSYAVMATYSFCKQLVLIVFRTTQPWSLPRYNSYPET